MLKELMQKWMSAENGLERIPSGVRKCLRAFNKNFSNCEVKAWQRESRK